MEFLSLFVVALMPVLKVLVITGLGLFLATERADLLGATARQNLNNLVFYVFSPTLIGSSLADTITLKSFATLWFMPINIFLAFAIGSLLGWILTKITKTPPKLRGLVIGCCSAGNVGSLLLVILPAVCAEADSPFGDSTTCSTYAEAYAALSMSILVVYIWSYVYIIMRVSSASTEMEESESSENVSSDNLREALLTCRDSELPNSDDQGKMKISSRIMKHVKSVTRHLKLKMIMAPATIAAIVGFVIGTISPVRKLIIGDSAPLRVIYTSTSLLGEAAVPCITLIVGGNLLKGLKGPGVGYPIILGIIGIRYVALPLCGIGILKVARHFEMVGTDSFYQFTLLLQYAVPPAMNIGTIAQLLDAGQSECSVIMLWTYASASLVLTLWSTFFMSLVT